MISTETNTKKDEMKQRELFNNNKPSEAAEREKGNKSGRDTPGCLMIEWKQRKKN